MTLATAYLTGDQTELYALFGTEEWERVLELSWSGAGKKVVREIEAVLRSADSE